MKKICIIALLSFITIGTFASEKPSLAYCENQMYTWKYKTVRQYERKTGCNFKETRESILKVQRGQY